MRNWEWIERNPLRAWRKPRRIYLREVAEAAGVSIISVQKWENGTVRPDIPNMMRLAEYMKMDFQELAEAWIAWQNEQ
jgi:transcriptional regulator with XRE-family HTH domain